jgi:hypothetical protein
MHKGKAGWSPLIIHSFCHLMKTPQPSYHADNHLVCTDSCSNTQCVTWHSHVLSK